MVSVEEQQSSFSCLATEAGGGVGRDCKQQRKAERSVKNEFNVQVIPRWVKRDLCSANIYSHRLFVT